MSASDVAVAVRDLSKAYTIAHQGEKHVTLAETLLARARRPFARPATETFWALKGLNFNINRGDVVGIIGRNGAGKSTLLKILSRITEPTAGHINLYGRVGSLLEVGTGFHPELTGRENIFLNGAILGMSKAEIRKQFDAIVEFSEVEQFLDTPVKRYSSGMYVRLAFAVAAHMRTEILVVDEVLAVGDTSFQEKCLGKMKSVAEGGRTVLFVSHNAHAIASLTNRCIYLRKGRVSFEGPSREALKLYQVGGHGRSIAEYHAEVDFKSPRIKSVMLICSEAEGLQKHGKSMQTVVEVFTPRSLRNAALSVQVIDQGGRAVGHTWILDEKTPICREPGVTRFTCSIPRLRLFMGEYFLRVHLGERSPNYLVETVDGVCPFTVEMNEQGRHDWNPDEAVYLEDCNWDLEAAGSR